MSAMEMGQHVEGCLTPHWPTHNPSGEAGGPPCAESTPRHLCTTPTISQHVANGWQTQLACSRSVPVQQHGLGSRVSLRFSELASCTES